MDELDIATITKRTVQGIIALVTRSFILQLISFAAFIIVATNLNAGEFGTFIIVSNIQLIISFFIDFGLGAALVQKKEELEQEEINTVFTVQFLVTGFIFLLIFIFRDKAKDFVAFFSSDKLSDEGTWLLVSLTFTLFLSSFKLIPSILLERKIQFQKLVIPQIVESLFFNLILVILLLQGFGIRSYTFAFAISSLIGIPAYYVISPWVVRFQITKRALFHLKFGVQFQAKNILANIKDRFLWLFLGASLGSVKVGYIGFAEKLAYFVYRFVVDSVTKVIFSTYARLQGEKEHLERSLEKSLFYVSSIMFPAIVGVMIIMPYFFSFYEKWHKWQPTVLSLIFYCLAAAVSSLSGILVNVLDANGKVKKTLQLMVIWTVLTWGLTIFFIQFYDFNGVAIASFFVTLTIAYTIYLVKQIVRFHFFQSISKPLAGTIVMGLFIMALAQVVAKNIMTVFFVILMGAAVYITSMYFLAGKEIIQDIKKIRFKQ